MRISKVLALAIALSVAVSGVWAAGQKDAAPAAGKVVKIGVTMALFDDVWLTLVRDSMTKWATEKGSEIQLTIVDAKNDTNKQVGQVENFLAQKMDAIVILPVDTAATGPMTKAVTGANIPLVYVNRFPANLPKGVVYCGSNSIDSGIFMMTELGKLMGGKGNVVILMGELSNEAALARTDGTKKVIAEKYPAIKVIREQTGNWKRDQGRTIMENWLASGDQIDGVAANNDEMALGAIMAIEAAGKLGKILVGGVDGSADALAAIDKGKLSCTVFQDPVGQGVGAVEAAYLMATKQANPRVTNDIIWIPYVPITKDNYKDFMK